MASEGASNLDIDRLRRWIGRREDATDLATQDTVAGVAAWLDHRDPPWPPAALPPLGHWFCFLPRPLQSELGEDGHPKLGGFLPLIPLPRRMWAGSRIEFLRPAALSRPLRQQTTITDIALKTGASGAFVKLTLTKTVFDGEAMAIREEQDLVYREAAVVGATPLAQPAEQPKACDYQRTVTPDPKLLFRFSALTANAHRIHYDRDYARDVEGYPDLVVHGPMQAVLLIDHYLRNSPEAEVAHFTCRAQRPLFNGSDFVLKERRIEDGAMLWTEDAMGRTCMEARIRASG
jgi:3-methylfumaryl-CoA hydratase